jgi:hypothetical protein
MILGKIIFVRVSALTLWNVFHDFLINLSIPFVSLFLFRYFLLSMSFLFVWFFARELLVPLIFPPLIIILACSWELSWITRDSARPDWVEGFLKAPLAATLWLMSDHGAQLRWKDQLGANPNPPCQHSLWEETAVPGENPRLSVERGVWRHLQVHSELLYAIPWSPFWFWFRKNYVIFAQKMT